MATEDTVEKVLKPLDYSATFAEARERCINDATGTELYEHLARVAYEHGARAAINAMSDVREVLSAAKGYLMNAKIDLETGCPKATAVRTIEGGIKRIDAALESLSGGGGE